MAALARLCAVLLAVSGGCVAGTTGTVPAWAVGAAIIAGGAAAVARGSASTRAAGILTVCFAIALAAAGARTRPSPVESLARSAPRCSVTGRVGERTAFGTVITLQRAACAPGVVDDPGSVLLDTSAPPGATITAAGWLVPLGPLPRGHVPPDVAAAFEATSVTVVLGPAGLQRPADAIRRGLATATTDLPGAAGDLIEGLVTGDTEGMPAPVIGSFRRAGLSHILAVSGSNVAIVVGGVLAATVRLGLKARLFSAASALLVFVTVVGPEPSVLRAAVVGTIALLALGSGMRTRPMHVLIVATIVLLVARPWLVFAPGLHLSVAATAGILLWARRLIASMSFLPRAVAGIGGVTMAAQAAVAPISIATFGELSLIAPVANALALPAVAPATILGMTAGLVSPIAPTPGRIIGRAAQPFAQWVLMIGDMCGRWTWAAIQPDEIWGVVVALPVVAAAIIALRDQSA